MTTTTPKKRVRRAKSAASRAMPLEVNKATAKKAIKIGAMSAGAWVAGKALFSLARAAVGTVLVIAAAAAAASLLPKETQKQLAGNVRDAASLAADRVRALTA